MEAAATILFASGFVIQAIGGLWLLIEMFKTNVAWGLIQMFCCGLAFIPWLAKNWEKGKDAFFVAVVGLILMGGGFFLGYRGILFKLLIERSW